eukprot:1492284-Lingulodinium_polyedra.AAC.1
MLAPECILKERALAKPAGKLVGHAVLVHKFARFARALASLHRTPEVSTCTTHRSKSPLTDRAT